MLKKFKILLAVFVLFSFTSIFAEEWCHLPDVDDKYIGTYIPVDFENHIKREKNIYGAYPMGYPNHHDVLFLSKNICYTDAHFHDGYAVSAEDFKDYRFVTNSAGTFCIDEKGNSYHKITNYLNEHGYGYNEYFEYVVKLLLSFVTDMNTVDIKGETLILDGKEYTVNLDSLFFETENVVLWLFAKGEGWYALIKNGVNGELHSSYSGEYRTLYPKNEVIKEFPLMFLKTDEELPYYSNLPKEQFRYLRNLVYARHGYVFKSAELKEFFSKFAWYKPNKKFSEDLLTNKEKEYVKTMQKKETDSK